MKKSKMRNAGRKNGLHLTGAILILVGALSIFPKNDTLIHNALQITFVIGCILFVMGGRLSKKVKCPIVGVIFTLSLACTSNLSAQNYEQQIQAFEESFNKKDITVIQPFLSDSLKFAPLRVQNTIPVLTNIVTKLPKLNALRIIRAEKGKIYAKYDFEQLGVSESEILFDSNGKITRIEFVENLIKEEIKQQRKLQSSVQVPKPDKIEFNYSKESIEFPSKDGLIISADLYEVDPNKPVILLCHQAGYNKYEYADIAPRLNKLGFNSVAIDQRSGGNFADKPNETYNRAIQSSAAKIDFTDAIQDIEAAINYLSDQYQQKIIVWGSSYSSSLALHIAVKNKNVKAVISFSPGDYFGDNLPSLEVVLPKIEQPYWVTSSKEEAGKLKKLIGNVEQDQLHGQYIPSSEGFHGSRALWVDQKGSEEYWMAIKSFLSQIKSHQ